MQGTGLPTAEREGGTLGVQRCAVSDTERPHSLGENSVAVVELGSQQWIVGGEEREREESRARSSSGDTSSVLFTSHKPFALHLKARSASLRRDSPKVLYHSMKKVTKCNIVALAKVKGAQSF